MDNVEQWLNEPVKVWRLVVALILLGGDRRLSQQPFCL